MIKCYVVENASTGGDICSKVIVIVNKVGGADNGDDSSYLKDAIRPKNMA